MALTEEKILGRTIRILGVSNSIDMTASASGPFPIFEVGSVGNRAPESKTFVAFVGLEFTGGSGSAALRIGNSLNVSVSADWIAVTALTTADQILTAPSGVDTYSNGVTFAAYVATGSSAGTGVITAYGWSE